MKKRSCIIVAAILAFTMTACGGSADTKVAPDTPEEIQAPETNPESAPAADDASSDTADDAEDFRIGIVTGSFSQSEDDRRGAEAFQKKYGADKVTLAIIVNQAVEGTDEAFRRIKEVRPDILCIAGETFDVFEEMGDLADLVVNNDFVSRGYLMIRTAHELGCDTFVHISFPRHLSYETYARRVNIMKAACEEFGMKFAMEEAPDPTTEVGVPGAQEYITEHVPEWVKKYGQNSAYFCTNDAHTEPLIKGLIENGGYFIEADLPSPLMGYPGALDLDLTGAGGDFGKITSEVEEAIVAAGGAGRFGTWTSSYGFANSAGLAEHARNVLLGRSDLTDLNAIREAYKIYTPETEWNGAKYTNAETGKAFDNIFLVYQDTYIFGDPGRYMGVTKISVPEEYYTIR